jgi:hypothetical protein
MTVQSGLSTALDAYIQSNFTGTLDQVSASKLNLQSLLQIQRSLSSVLPNGTLINGVANFYTATKPTTRVDGSALVIGDVWKKAGQESSEWDGTQWVGNLRQFLILTASISSTTSSNNAFYPLGSKISLKKFEATGRVEAAPAAPANDYWTFDLTLSAGGGSTALGSPVSINNQNVAYTAFDSLALSVATNQVVDFSGAINDSPSLARGFFVTWTKSGAAPNLTGVSFSIQYRIIYE